MTLPTITVVTSGSASADQVAEIVHYCTLGASLAAQHKTIAAGAAIAVTIVDSLPGLVASSSDAEQQEVSFQGRQVLIPTDSGSTFVGLSAWGALAPWQRAQALVHEVCGHVLLGFVGQLAQDGTLPPGTLPSGYDTRVQAIGGQLFFVSDETTAVLGGPVPLHMPAGLGAEAPYHVTPPGSGGFVDMMNPTVALPALGPSCLDLAMGLAAGVGLSTIFDPRLFYAEWYLGLPQNLPVLEAVLEGLTTAWGHFDTFGWREGRDPSAYFSTTGYLHAYADVAAAGINPLTHYRMFGAHEGRSPIG